jgi:hypothetical protein
MIATFDTETAGLFGRIRLIGWYNGRDYCVSTKPRDWYEDAVALEQYGHSVWYAHNLDFDWAKLWQSLPELHEQIEWGKSLFIHFKAVKIVLKNGVELRDSLVLLPGSLDSVLRSWGTEIGKLSSEELAWAGGYKDKEDYFKRVPLTDEYYREYLRHDVMGLYEVLSKLRDFTGLPDEIFCKRLTTAGLAMFLFKTWFPDQYSELTWSHWSAESDEYMRRAFYGGRTEVFATHVENGFHYDVNSLYPHEMGTNSYPCGYPEIVEGEAANQAWKEYLPNNVGLRIYKACIVTATVHIPSDLFIPPLPVRVGGRLVFPTGTLTNTWCGCELEMACKYGVEVLDIQTFWGWLQAAPFFMGWVAKMSERKMHAQGAEREFYKLLQNSLYGKFAQQREQINVCEWTAEGEDKLEEKDTPYKVRETCCGKLMDFVVSRSAPHMQPHIAAHITAYARIHLYEAIATELMRENDVIYCDTDSLVTRSRMLPNVVAPNRYGFWKLERQVALGLYVSPKLYGETEPGGAEFLKGKGLIRSYRESMAFSDYCDIVRDLAAGMPIVELYKGIPNRRRWLRSVLGGLDVDTPRMESKSVHGGTWQKRCVDWRSGVTRPWSFSEILGFAGLLEPEGVDSG